MPYGLYNLRFSKEMRYLNDNTTAFVLSYCKWFPLIHLILYMFIQKKIQNILTYQNALYH